MSDWYLARQLRELPAGHPRHPPPGLPRRADGAPWRGPSKTSSRSTTCSPTSTHSDTRNDHLMAYVAIADRDHEHALHDPADLHPQVHLEPGSQGHRDPVRAGRDLRRPGRAGAVGADAPAARLPRHVPLHRAAGLLPVHHHARHDHGDLPADRAVPRRLRQLPHPAHVRRAGHGVPVHEHAELLGLPARGARAARGLLRAGRSDRRRLDAVPAAGDRCRERRATAGASSACSSRSASSSSRSRWAASTT